MRNSTQRVIVILVLCAVSGLLLNVEPIRGDESLTVTKDQFEFRDSPQVTEETLIGTLRVGTAVEWTGIVSGDWFQVRGPGNQIGWIHKSGLSAPKTAPTSQQQSTTAPAGTSGTRATRAPSTSTQQKQITELEKANTQYKALLNEKELRVTELTREIEELEQKLLDTAQEVSDSQQMRQMQQAQATELEKQVDELIATLEAKETELRENKVEMTTLQTQFTNLQNRASQMHPMERYILYGLTGLLGFLLLGAVFWYVRRNTPQGKEISPLPDQRPEHLHQGTSVRPGEAEPQIEPAPQVSPSPPLPTNEYIEEEVEDVEIELSDVLPTADLDSPEPTGEGEEEVHDIDIISEDDLDIVADLDVIDEVEAIDEIAEIEEIEVVDAIEVIRDNEDIDELPGHEARMSNMMSDGSEQALLHEELEELEDHLDIPDDEETGSHSDFDFDSIYEYESDALLDEGDTLTKIPVPASEPVDIAGETYEMLVEQSTQIIETDDDDDLEEEVLRAPKAFEDIPDVESEELPTLKEEIEDLSDLLEAREIELEEIHSYVDKEHVVDEEMEDWDDGQEHDVEIEDVEEIEEFEDIDDLDDIELIEDIDDTVFEAEGESVFESVSAERPDLLEPSPVLIEPEYEPADVVLSGPVKKDAVPTTVNASTYEIELVQVGDNTAQIVEFLAKVKGLPKSPDELVRTVPTVITRDAKEIDAKNFQLLMQKLGATVRVKKH